MHLSECRLHEKRLYQALAHLETRPGFPFDGQSYRHLQETDALLAFSDQVIYRFSKLQDTMGAKLFRSLLAYEGENIDRPFLDLLNVLERMEVLDVEEWFEIREIRNEIAHDYETEEEKGAELLNTIHAVAEEVTKILDRIEALLK